MTNYLRVSAGLAAVATLSLALFSSPALAAPTPSPSETTSPSPVASPSATTSATPTPTATPRVPPTGPFPACSASKALASKSLGKLYAYVINADTGKVLVNLRGSETTPSASVLKVLTASAASEIVVKDLRAGVAVEAQRHGPGVHDVVARRRRQRVAEAGTEHPREHRATGKRASHVG